MPASSSKSRQQGAQAALPDHLKPVVTRSVVIRAIRTFFEERGFYEVTVPVLNRALPLEPTLYAFETTWRTEQAVPLYLTTSPESGLKKLLGQGLGDSFAIGKCFRNLENSGNRHNPEFLMLEWYRKDARYAQIMADAQALILAVQMAVQEYWGRRTGTLLQYQGQSFELASTWPVLSLDALCQEYLGIGLKNLDDDAQLRAAARAQGFEALSGSWEQVFHQLMLNKIEPHFPQQPFFLIDFPSKLSPLCTRKPGSPHLADRFELYFGQMEIANGNNENTDSGAVRQAFEAERTRRQDAGEMSHPVDEVFLQSLEKLQRSSNTGYAGIGLGVDRLAMLVADAPQITDVEPFCV